MLFGDLNDETTAILFASCKDFFPGIYPDQVRLSGYKTVINPTLPFHQNAIAWNNLMILDQYFIFRLDFINGSDYPVFSLSDP